MKYSVTASVGAAVFPGDGNTFENLYKSADNALYVSKRRGKISLRSTKSRKKRHSRDHLVENVQEIETDLFNLTSI